MAFYDQWKFFTTGKQFAYADVYNPKEAPNRRVKRLIENENKKERQKERVKFNEVVRELVDRIREKDPRYRKFMMQIQKEKEEKRRKLEAEKQAKKETEAARLKDFREERAREWQKEEDRMIKEGLVVEEIVEVYTCEVCKKTYKKEALLTNHLQSKKHKDAAKKFREKYQLDDDTEMIFQKKADEQKQDDPEEVKEEAAVEEEVALDDVDDWAWKSGKKGKKEKKMAKGGAAKGHNAQIEEMNQEYSKMKQNQREKIKEKEQKKWEEYQKKKAEKIANFKKEQEKEAK